jgi:GNAT superfamily N-acetyltransferase
MPLIMLPDPSGPGGASIHDVAGIDSPLLETACNLFEAIFPDEGRYLPYLRACAQRQNRSHPNTYDHVWLVRQNGEWVGLRIFSYITTRNFGHGAYLGLTPDQRGRGLGTWLVERTLVQLDRDASKFGRESAIGYLVESERPMDAPDEEQRNLRKKRLKFHRQCGGIILPVTYTEPVMIEGVDYLDPASLQNETPRPMHLVFIPSKAGSSLPHLDLVELVSGIYLDVYRLQPDHEFIRKSLSFLKEIVHDRNG